MWSLSQQISLTWIHDKINTEWIVEFEMNLLQYMIFSVKYVDQITKSQMNSSIEYKK